MKTLALTVAALVALAAASTADAWPGVKCNPMICASNGPQLTGIARRALEATRPVINAVTLASSETVDRTHATK
jgi:hypothetical protein